MESRILKVSQINQYIKNLFDHDYVLRNAMVEGEISNYKLHSSGHAYFSLKDSKASISCVLFRGNRANVDIDLMNGMKVMVKGQISVYERDGRYQIYVKEVSDGGLGLLYQKYELLKRECEGKGYFLEENKLEVPKYPMKVGVVTSPTGAAVQDIINVSKRRNPYCQLVLYPALVQGPGAYKTVVAGIEYFNEVEPVDVMIIGRGGGSIEDLWAFNEKAVVEAIVASKIPIVSAVGHETDFTLSDFASDLRAPTPSAGAELAVFDYNNLMMLLDQKQTTMDNMIFYKIEDLKNKLKHHALRLEHLSPMQQLVDKQKRIDELSGLMTRLMGVKLEQYKSKLALLEAKVIGLSPTAKLKNGYGYISKNNKPLTSASNIEAGDEIKVMLHDGVVTSNVSEVILDTQDK